MEVRLSPTPERPRDKNDDANMEPVPPRAPIGASRGEPYEPGYATVNDTAEDGGPIESNQ